MVAAALAVTREPAAAEDAAQAAIEQALVAWRGDRWPDDATAWLVAAAKRRAIDQLRRQATAERLQGEVLALEQERAGSLAAQEQQEEDADLLRLVFMCCHPSLSRNAQIALTLRHVGGLTAAEIARAGNSRTATVQQRITRATDAIRQQNMVLDQIERQHISTRLPGVLDVISLIFNEGYNATAGERLIREDLVLRATNMVEDLAQRLPQHVEVRGLAALCAFQSSRLRAKNAGGGFVPLEHQDRSLWDMAAVQRGNRHLASVEGRRWGYYGIQAAIAACHANAPSFAHTDWQAVVRLYDDLSAIDSGPFVQLNRWVAVLKSGDAAAAITGMLALEPALRDVNYLHAGLAEALLADGQVEAARQRLQQALAVTRNNVEQTYLQQRLDQLSNA